ncbi:MAG: hypothetical protein ABL961_10000 [Vicinamibacterales bacterium]
MYGTVLLVHSWMRWVTLLLTIAAVVNAARPVTSGELPGRAWDRFSMMAIDTQVLIGLFLYFGLSPFTVESLNNMAVTMKTPALRFFAIEHIFGMLLVMALVRVARITSAHAKSPADAGRKRLIFFGLALLVMLGTIPWPGLVYGRPLFRLH